MNTTRRAIVVTPSFVLICFAVPMAQAQRFSGLGFLPGGTQSAASRVSSDGSVVVGAASNHAFRWTSPKARSTWVRSRTTARGAP
jgi:uncharacterized membrane protein